MIVNTPQEMDEEEKESIEDLLNSLEDFVPAIPDEVVNYYLTKTGFMCSDEKIRRLVSLAAQKFVADIAEDALQYCKIRQQSPANRDKHRGKEGQRLVLTMDDLSQSLKEYGITVKKPEYFVDRSASAAGATLSASTSSAATSASGPDKKKKRTK